MTLPKETKTEIENIRHRAVELQRQAADREAEARQAAIEADRMDRALQVHRERGSVSFHETVLAEHQETRSRLLMALTEARSAFADAVLAGKPYIPQFLAIKQAEHELAVHGALHEFALAKLRNKAISMQRHELPETTLLDELNLVTEAQVAPLREIDSEARRRVAEAVDAWCDAHAVNLDGDLEMEVA